MNIMKMPATIQEMIIPATPNKNTRRDGDHRMMKLYRTISQNACFPDCRCWYADKRVELRKYVSVHCREHARMELVPEVNFQEELHLWYRLGLHPRFSIVKVLMDAGQRYFEILGFVNPWGGGEARARVRVADALRISHTPKEFMANMRPHLRTNLYWRGRRYRVTTVFKKKFEARAFTIKDFFMENNQELRRLILSRGGLSIGLIRKAMRKGRSSKEGTLYRYRNGNYLYVKCPSTGQEYLLSVPQFDSPGEARRWTFGLPPDATFVKEA